MDNSEKKLRIYLENSVICGYFDVEFRVATTKLFDMFRQGIFIPVISDHTMFELDAGAQPKIYDNLNTLQFQLYKTNDEMNILKEKYLQKKIVTPKYGADALHIAIATIIQVDILVSWNFKHIVNFDKIKLFNAVNVKEGYKPIMILTPMEVIKNEE